jgi:hypothetical protein
LAEGFRLRLVLAILGPGRVYGLDIKWRRVINRNTSIEHFSSAFSSRGAELRGWLFPADDKRRARLNLIRHLLDSIPYKKVNEDLPKIPKAQPRPKDATEGLGAGKPIPSHY